MLNYFTNKTASGDLCLNSTGIITVIAVLIILFAVISLIPKQKRESKFSTKQLVFSAICLGLAVVTSTFKLFEAPMGGSVTLCSMLFLTLIGYWYGPSIAFTASFAFGFIQLFIHPTILSIPQVFLDYILAFGAFGLAGLFSNKKYGLIKGYIVSMFARWFIATISGVVFFAAYAGDQNVWIYSMSYNAFYLAIEGAITVVVLAVPPVYNAFTTVKKLALE